MHCTCIGSRKQNLEDMKASSWRKYVETSNAYIAKLEKRLKELESQKRDSHRRIDHLKKNLKVADNAMDLVSYVYRTEVYFNDYHNVIVNNTGMHAFCLVKKVKLRRKIRHRKVENRLWRFLSYKR